MNSAMRVSLAVTVSVLLPAGALSQGGEPPARVPAAQWVDQVMSVRSLLGSETPQWAPDGSAIMFASNLGGATGLWQVNKGGGWPTRLAPDIGSSRMAQLPRWSPTGEWIAYIADQAEATDLWLWSARDGRSVRLTRMGARIGAFSWSPDGKTIAFAGSRYGNYDVWTVSVPEGEARRLTTDTRIEHSPTWTPGGTGIVYVRTDDRWVDHDILEIPAAGGEPRLVVQDKDFFDYQTIGVPSFGPGQVSPDGRSVLFRSWRSGWINYWVVPMTGGQPRAIAPDRWDQSGARWSPDGTRIAYLSNRNGTHELRMVSAAGGEPRALVAPTMGIVANAEWSPDGNSLSYTLGTPTRAPDLFVVDLATGGSRQLTFSAPGGNIEASLVTPEKISYRSDTLTIHAYLYKPRGLRPGERLPAVLFSHGGPTGQYGDGYDQEMQFFAGQGYVVLAPNFRGGAGYGRPFADLNNKCWAHCDLADFVAGVEHLKTLPYVNGNAVGITGTSHGGLVAMAAATFAPGVFQAAVAHSGTADRVHYYRTQILQHIKQAENEFGPLAGNEDVYRYVSPFYFAEDVNTPIFVLWGEGRWPGSDNSARYVAELERHYKPHRAKVYHGETYYVRGRANVRQMLLDQLDFFEQYLGRPGGPPPAAASLGHGPAR